MYSLTFPPSIAHTSPFAFENSHRGNKHPIVYAIYGPFLGHSSFLPEQTTNRFRSPEVSWAQRFQTIVFSDRHEVDYTVFKAGLFNLTMSPSVDNRHMYMELR